MKNFTQRLASRKLWVTVSTVIALIASGQYEAATAVVLGYLGVQGVVDARNPANATQPPTG